VTTAIDIAILLAGTVSLIATRLVIAACRRWSLFDVPTDRSMHALPTPRLGGIGIMLGTVAGWLAASGWTDADGSVILGASVALGLLGVADDLGRMTLIAKYLGQLGAAVVVVVVLEPTLRIGAFGADVMIDGLPAYILTALGLTAIVNAFNFMDGIDGIIAMVSVAIAVSMVGIVSPAAGVVAVILAASCAGFLVWNQAPAAIFMGDSGSHFLGLLTGATLLRGTGGSVDVIPMALLLAPLLFDTGFTLVRRARAGQDLLTGHRGHLYQRLAATTSHRAVAAGYAAATAIFGIAAIEWMIVGSAVQILILAGAAATGLTYISLVARREAAEPR
jgi:UDP-N-acetylmuramyl pentapeptide phosphotransferase/UDP-N-acetylglucosamine-1-phosphate transferase